MHKRASEDKTPSEARPFSVCGWLCGQRQKPEFKSSRIVAKVKENIRFSSEKRMFCGADRQIRTADLILTNWLGAFQPLRFNAFRAFLLQKDEVGGSLWSIVSVQTFPRVGQRVGQVFSPGFQIPSKLLNADLDPVPRVVVRIANLIP